MAIVGKALCVKNLRFWHSGAKQVRRPERHLPPCLTTRLIIFVSPLDIIVEF